MSDRFKTIARFQYSTEAQIVKGRLEAEGIQVFLSDHITIDTDPLVSNAIGGVKLKVLALDALKAQYILKSIKNNALDDAGKPIFCPNCKSQSVEISSSITNLKSLLQFVMMALFLKSRTPAKYECNTCKTPFHLQ